MDAPAPTPSTGLDYSHWVIFHRPEFGQDFALFGDSLRVLLEENPSIVRKISIVNAVSGNGVDEYIRGLMEKSPSVEWCVFSNTDIEKQIEYMHETKGLPVVAVKQGIIPAIVVRCIMDEWPFIATSVGGIAEYADPNWLAEPSPQKLAAKLRTLPELFSVPPKHAYHREQAIAALGNLLTLSPKPIPVVETGTPKVSVCVPFYNYGRFLPRLLDAFDKQDYPNFEVILVNDGSRKSSQEIFDLYKSQRETPARRFFTKENGGIGHTRNFAARQATGDYLIFFDADNVPTPDMISSLVHGIQHAGTDCVTCYYSAFPPEDLPIPGTPEAAKAEPKGWFYPVGQAIECGFLENVFGDAHMLIKRDVFFEIGGFTEDRGLSWEDWEFMIRLSIRGYTLEVVPRILQYYGLTAEGASRTTDVYDNRMRILRPYFEGRPDWECRLIRDIGMGGLLTGVDQLNKIFALQNEK